MAIQLGDSHNFGRRVTLRGGRVAKPRTLLWEWWLLGRDSPLRTLLDEKARDGELGASAFRFLPSLRFYGPRARGFHEVERVELEPLRALGSAGKRELAAIVGRALALFGWLGVCDLHWENLVLGRSKDGVLVFGPLDVEMILSDMERPTETKLLPDADPEYAAICRHAAGVRRVLPYLGKPVAPPLLLEMVAAYRATLDFLERHARAIARAFLELEGLRQAPIRVCLRGTEQYVHAATHEPWPPLLDAEREQLARGDIPYFFRLYGEPGIRYYADQRLSRVERLPSRGDAPQLDRMLSLGSKLSSPSREKLRDEGPFTLLGAFDHPSLDGRHEHPALAVEFRARRLVVSFPNGEELKARRDLSAFVGSVYLPCRCGEVRSVFVPPVTRCRSSG